LEGNKLKLTIFPIDFSNSHFGDYVLWSHFKQAALLKLDWCGTNLYFLAFLNQLYHALVLLSQIKQFNGLPKESTM
jgi:hypothetical protein